MLTRAGRAQPAAIYKSKLEERVAKQIEAFGLPVAYETEKIQYEVPARRARYTPDFKIGGIYIEAKGRFRTAADRQKLIHVKQQHPDLDLRLVFQKSTLPIYKGSNTTYADWAESNGFLWADKGEIPTSWLREAKRTSPTS